MFSQTLPASPELGTWKVEFKINGSKLGEDTFVVTTDGAPELRVEEDGEIILDERYTPVDFGTVSLNAASPAKTFTVTNHGDDTLTLTTPVVPAGFLGQRSTGDQPGTRGIRYFYGQPGHGDGRLLCRASSFCQQ